MIQKNLLSKIKEASNIISSHSTRGTANYIITNKNISDMLFWNFRKVDRIMKIEKILERI